MASKQEQKVPTLPFDTTLGSESEAATKCKAWLRAKGEIAKAEAILETLKPEIDALRGGVKKVAIQGEYRDQKGRFIVNHVDPTDRYTASVDVARELLAAGVLNQAQFDRLVTKGETSGHNLVSFKPGTGKP